MSDRQVLICVETGEGHTLTVAERMATQLEAAGHSARVIRCRDVTAAELEQAFGVLVGVSIHMGKPHKRVVRFAKEHLAALGARPAALFLVCLTARSAEARHVAEVQRYLEEFATQTGWRPELRQAFAGALLYTQYGFVKRRVMKSVVAKEGGDTDTSRDFVYTDWQAVDAFVGRFVELLGQARG